MCTQSGFLPRTVSWGDEWPLEQVSHMWLSQQTAAH